MAGSNTRTAANTVGLPFIRRSYRRVVGLSKQQNETFNKFNVLPRQPSACFDSMSCFAHDQDIGIGQGLAFSRCETLRPPNVLPCGEADIGRDQRLGFCCYLTLIMSNVSLCWFS